MQFIRRHVPNNLDIDLAKLLVIDAILCFICACYPCTSSLVLNQGVVFAGVGELEKILTIFGFLSLGSVFHNGLFCNFYILLSL